MELRPARGIPRPPRSKTRMPHPYFKDKTALVSRLHKIEGQIRGLARMVESDEYCIDILTQIASARSALESLGLVLLQDHIEGCERFAEGGFRRGAGRRIDRCSQSLHQDV